LILLARNFIRQTRQQIECSHHVSIFFPQDDLIPTPKDLHFLAPQSELFWQPDRLTVPGTENSRSAHAPTPNNVYTSSYKEVLLVSKGRLAGAADDQSLPSVAGVIAGLARPLV